MSVLFDISVVALSCVVIVQSLTLRAVLQESLRLEHLFHEPEENLDSAGRALGAAMPPFQARLLDSSDLVTDGDLLGHPAILLFVTPSVASSLAPDKLAAMIYALWNKTDEPLYIVCDGSDAECRLLRDEQGLVERYGDSVKVVLDEGSDLTLLFGITATPSAMIFDERGRVRKTGRPLPAHGTGPAETATGVAA